MNILLVRLSSLGDILHVLPSLRALRQSFPGARLGWVVEDSFKDLLSGLPELDHLYILSRERSRGSWKEQLQLGREMKSRLQQVPWDVAIDFQGLWKSLRVCRWARAKRVLGYSPSPERTHFLYTDPVPLPSMDRHAVDRHPLGAKFGDEGIDRRGLRTAATDGQRGARRQERLVGKIGGGPRQRLERRSGQRLHAGAAIAFVPEGRRPACRMIAGHLLGLDHQHAAVRRQRGGQACTGYARADDQHVGGGWARVGHATPHIRWPAECNPAGARSWLLFDKP